MPNGAPAYELFPSYERLFFTREGNHEFLITRMQGMTNNVENAMVRQDIQGLPVIRV